jgi:prevent-host-death family protein
VGTQGLTKAAIVAILKEKVRHSMRSVGVRELKDNLSQYLDRVEKTGRPIYITRNGRTIAEIRPCHAHRRPTVEEEFSRLAAEGEMELAEGSEPKDWPLPKDYIKFDWKTIYDETREDRFFPL